MNLPFDSRGLEFFRGARLRTVGALLAIVTATGPWLLPSSLAQPPVPPARPLHAELIDRLGSVVFAEREEAERRLIDADLAARDALVAGLRHADPEVRRRSRLALGIVLERDFRRKVQQLREDPDGKLPVNLPGWNLYCDLVGAERASRSLFAEMVAEEPGVFESLEAGAVNPVRLRVTEIFYRTIIQDGQPQEQPGRATIATLLIASSQPKMDSVEWTNLWNNLANQLQHGQFVEAINEGPLKEPLRALTEAWLKLPTTTQLETQKLRIAVSQGFHEIAIAKSLAALSRADKRTSIEVAGTLECLALVGGKAHAHTIAKHLTDERLLQTRILPKNERQDLQVRDVALALLVDLTEQDPAAYGFKQAKAWLDTVKKQQQNRGNLIFNFGSFFPEQGTDRAASLERWSQWVKAHPLPESPPPSKLVEQFAAQAQVRPPRIAAGPKNAGKATDPPVESGRGLQMADREIVAALKRVPALLAEQHYAEAVKVLGDVLAADEDYCYRPANDPALLRQVKAHAEQLLADCPARALAEYELHYGALAKSLVEKAVAASDARALADVERRYFFTQAGTEACFLLGSQHRTQGRFTSAALYFERLRRLSTAADRFEPALSAQLAFCWQQAGMTRRAAEVVEHLRQRQPHVAVEIAGRKVALPGPDADAAKWLQALLGAAGRIEPQWPVFAGSPSGNSVAPEGAPWLAGNAWPASTTNEWLASITRQIPATFAQERRTQLPTVRPLVAGSQVIVRTATSLVSYHRATGQIAWEAKAAINLATLLELEDGKQRESRAVSVTAGLKRRLWDDLGFGALSTDGRRVYVLEDCGYRLGSVSKWLRVRDDGRREIDETPFVGQSRLAAYDLQTGKLLWEHGESSPMSVSGFVGVRFLGPALPLGDQAYAVVEYPSQTLLAALDGQTGEFQEQWVLDVTADDPPMQSPLVPGGWPAEPLPLRAASPSYADGVVVCRTSRDRYIAFDLTQRSVRWSFKAPIPEANAQQRAMRRMMLGMARNQPDDLRSDEWCDAGAVLADGKVILTPAEGDQLFCLNLADGTLVWSAPRRDGLYVAGVAAGQVAIVGRNGLRAVRLADGKSAWSADRVDWPAGATPSGRGYLSGNTVQVPLTSAEVVTVDLRDGRLVARSRSPAGVVPGNLVQVDREVFTCSSTGLHRFETLAARTERLPALTADSLPAARLERAELEMYAGQIESALALLREVRATAPTPACNRLLAEALLLARPELLAGLVPLADEVAASVPEGPARSQLWQRIAEAHRTAGDFEAAVRSYCRGIDSIDSLHLTVDVTASRQVRRSQQIRSDVERLWNAAPVAQRKAIDDFIASRLTDANSEALLECFGFHPAAQASRLRLARQQADANRPLAAEFLWREVWRGGNDPQRAEAAARLAELLRGKGQVAEAARFFAELGGPLANVECRDGRTGGQLVAELAADSDLARYLATGDLFPLTKPNVTSEAKTQAPTEATSTMIYVPLRPASDGSSLAPRMFAAIDQRNRKLFGFDASGVRRWAVELATAQNSSVLGLQNQGFADCRTAGHLVIAWLGSRIFAVDPWTDGGKIVWSRDLLGSDPNRWWRLGAVRRRMQVVAVGAPTSSEISPQFAVTSRYVAFQEARMLTAVDPLTGEVLWMRDDLPPGCELFGDADRLIALPPDASEARVLHGADGSELQRTMLNRRGKQLGTHGTAFVHFDTEGQEARLERFDVATGTTTWTRNFSPQARAVLVDDTQLAVLETSGKFTVLATADAHSVFETNLDANDKLDSLFVLRNDREYYVAANRPEPKSDVPAHMNRRQPGYVRIDGVLSALDARTGKRLWQRNVEDQSMVACHPTESPVFVLLRRHQKVTPLENGGWSSGPPTLHVSCLDRRTGAELHSAEFKNGYDMSYRMHVNPEKREFVYQNSQHLATITYPEK